jgi:hypothetical protein
MSTATEAQPDHRDVRMIWNYPQSQFLQVRAVPGDVIEYVDLEGAVRAGKSTPAVAKLGTYAVEYPGIQMAACRWTQDALDAQLKPLWRDIARRMGLRLQWNAREEYDEIIGYGSRVYLRALKGSDDNTRYAKLAGMTLAVLYIDQPEEVPQDVHDAYVPARLSQPGFPHEAWYTPNPPGESHWLAKMFPERGGPPHHTYIRTTVRDNVANVGEAYIQDLEAAYPPGSALRRRFIEGCRGLAAIGEPVYAGYFSRRTHEVDPLSVNPEVALLEGWDFGHHHPCVVWSQFLPWGALHVLGGVMGESMFIEDFCPIVLQIRSQWFPGALEVKSTGDPAGTAANSQGTKRSAADVLKANGISLQVVPGANHPDRRNTAIQAAAGYMRRLTGQGPAFAVSPRFVVVGRNYQRPTAVLVDALEAGYVWDERSTASSGSPSTRRPKKDGWYDHSMNCLEYIVLKFGPVLPEVMPKQPAPAFAPVAPPSMTSNPALSWM